MTPHPTPITQKKHGVRYHIKTGTQQSLTRNQHEGDNGEWLPRTREPCSKDGIALQDIFCWA